jgi:hypothetical protein
LLSSVRRPARSLTLRGTFGPISCAAGTTRRRNELFDAGPLAPVAAVAGGFTPESRVRLFTPATARAAATSTTIAATTRRRP